MAKVHQPSKESDSEDFVIRLDPREWDGTFSGEGKGPNDSYDDDHIIRLDPREWDGTFSGEGKGSNDSYDDDHIIHLDPREWEGFEPAQPAAKPILESKAFNGDELLSRAFGEADPLDSSAGLSTDKATYSSHGIASSALDTIHDLAETSVPTL